MSVPAGTQSGEARERSTAGASPMNSIERSLESWSTDMILVTGGVPGTAWRHPLSSVQSSRASQMPTHVGGSVLRNVES